MPPPLVVPARRLCIGFDRLIEWAKEVRSLVCCMDPDMEISCEGKPPIPPNVLFDTTTQPILIAVTCPPAIVAPPSATTTAGDLCAAMTMLIAWAEDLKDIVCCIPADYKVRVPSDVLERGKLRKASLQKMKTPHALHTVRCPAPETRTRTRRPQPRRKRR